MDPLCIHGIILLLWYNSPLHIHYLSDVLFLIDVMLSLTMLMIGFKLLKQGWDTDPNPKKNEELEEVEGNFLSCSIQSRSYFSFITNCTQRNWNEVSMKKQIHQD
jgi:hypothetical protein